jgi:hypothetical protein
MSAATPPVALLGPSTSALLVAGADLSAACSDVTSPNPQNRTTLDSELQAITIAPATDCPAGTGGTTGTLNDGSKYEFCLPAGPAGGLVLYAHGYVKVGDPLAVRDDPIPVGNGSSRRVSDVVTSLGLVFGATSFPHNGLNGPEAVASRSPR